MKFTLSWLSNFISLDGLDSRLLSDKLTMLGLEVDAVEELFTDLDQIICARITRVSKHPNADKLSLCEVDPGNGEILNIVCGAPNVREGMVSALALPGTVLPGGIKIKKSKVRGEVSQGMLCSSRELGLNDEHSGILDLDADITPGTAVNTVLGLRDTMVEVDLTPNRPDCASVLGIAREVGSFSGQKARLPIHDLPAFTGETVDFNVLIEEPELCPRYAARKISGVSIGPSPDWMQRRLLAVGMRPINNVVDITNYVMLELGQPLHAFDFNTIKGNIIIVRCPKGTETHFTTLDNTERKIEADMLMICNEDEPVAVAGVMGGLESEVTDKTTDILLESACFNPISIRKTARRLNIPSEASYRFERGVDPEITLIALERAVQLMELYAGGTGHPDALDLYPGKTDRLELTLRPERVNDLLGTNLDNADITALLESIEFKVSIADSVLRVRIPSFRIDIEREIDLVEEVARLVGFNEIPTTLPQIGMDSPVKDSMRLLRKEAAGIMTSQGFYEAINYSFISDKFLDALSLADNDPRRQATILLNPLSEDQGIMRPIILPGLLENIRHNINRQQSGVKLFEIGKTFRQVEKDALPEEHYHLTAVLCGERYPFAEPLHFSETEADLFDLKGSIQQLLTSLRFSDAGFPLRWEAMDQQCSDAPYCDTDNGLYVYVQDVPVGVAAGIRKEILSNFGIKQPVYFFDIDLHTLLTVSRLDKKFQSLPKFPAVKRDIALLVPADVPAGHLLAAIEDSRQKMVESVTLFDVYKGKSVEEGFKSVAISVTYRADNKTLNDNAVEKIHNKLVDMLMSQFKARYRE